MQFLDLLFVGDHEKIYGAYFTKYGGRVLLDVGFKILLVHEALKLQGATFF